MKRNTAALLRRVCLMGAALIAVWAGVLRFTGGVAVRLAGARLSSHGLETPVLAAVILAALAIWLARPASLATLRGDAAAILRSAMRVSPVTWLVGFGIGLRIWYWLLAPPLWLDEEMIALNIRDRSLAHLAGPLWLGQAAPLGWLLTERIVATLFGLSELALRAMPAGFGIAALVIAWWAGRRWMSTLGAAAIVFLTAIGPWVFHYSLELKHYSADIGFGLLLPALAVWVLDGSDESERRRRAVLWWAAAIAGQWWSMGGLLVAPVCIVILLVALWQRDGWKSATFVAAVGMAWLVVFGLHYATTLRHTLGNTFLQETWSDAMAPEAAGLPWRLRWLLEQAGPIAEKPGGTALSWSFWITAWFGFVVARPRRLGLILAGVPLSAALLAVARIVPLYGRFTLWVMPSLYFGVALALDAGVRLAMRPSNGTLQRIVGATVAASAIVVSVDIGRHAYVEIPSAHGWESNHALDDRTAVEWMAAMIRPGDAILTTHLALPAVWWYGRAPVSRADSVAAISGAPIFELDYHAPAPPCDAVSWLRPLANASRVLVYFGFRVDDVPEGFDQMVLDRLQEHGTLVTRRSFAGRSAVAIVDLAPSDRPSTYTAPPRLLQGCLGTTPAARW